LLTLAQGRGVKTAPKESMLQGNFVVLSATTGDQTAYPYNDKSHGLIRNLQDGQAQDNLVK